MEKSEQKTVAEIIEEVCDEICNRYCMWPSAYESENADEETLYDEQCNHCPLMRLR